MKFMFMLFLALGFWSLNSLAEVQQGQYEVTKILPKGDFTLNFNGATVLVRLVSLKMNDEADKKIQHYLENHLLNKFIQVVFELSAGTSPEDIRLAYAIFKEDGKRTFINEELIKLGWATYERVESATYSKLQEKLLEASNELYAMDAGGVLSSTDYPVQRLFKQAALLSVDGKTEFKIQKIFEIQELILSKGRVRIKLLGSDNVWTVRNRDMILNISGNADVIVDMLGSLITRVFVLEGEARCTCSCNLKTYELTTGQHFSIGINDPIQTIINTSTRDYLTGFLSFSKVDAYAQNFGKYVKSAQIFTDR